MQPGGMSYGAMRGPFHPTLDAVVDNGLQRYLVAVVKRMRLHVGAIHQDDHAGPLDATEPVVEVVNGGVLNWLSARSVISRKAPGCRSVMSGSSLSDSGTMNSAVPLFVCHLRSRAGKGRGKPPGVHIRASKS